MRIRACLINPGRRDAVRANVHGIMAEPEAGTLFGREMRHERREERPQARLGDRGATRYQIRKRMISIGDDYMIENDRGEHVFKLNGKALPIRKTIRFEDMHGRELCKIQERMLHLRDSMEIEDPLGFRMALVQRVMMPREQWTIKVKHGPDLRVQGDAVDHEYTIERDKQRVAEVSKRWFQAHGTYGVEVAPGENDILILATAAVIDTMAHHGLHYGL
jgi:uncharacterized protein YxjI